MKKNHRFWLLALALSLLLTCAACGKQKTPAADTTPDTKQEQTTDTRKDDTAETGTTKADGKQDAAKTEDKTAGDKKSDEQKPAGEAKKTEEDTKKQEEAKRLEEQKRLEEEKKQQEQKQPSAPDPDPAPAPAPAPAASVSLYISCATVLNNMDKCSDGVKDIIPADGVILSATVTITEGESVMSVLKRACGDAGIPVSSSGSYVRGINGLFEKNVGRSSGWMYCVGGTFPNYGADSYTLSGGENIQWLYTCNMGADVGNTYMG